MSWKLCNFYWRTLHIRHYFETCLTSLEINIANKCKKCIFVFIVRSNHSFKHLIIFFQCIFKVSLLHTEVFWIKKHFLNNKMQNISPVNSQTNAGIDFYGSKMNQTDRSYYVAVLMLVNKNISPTYSTNIHLKFCLHQHTSFHRHISRTSQQPTMWLLL